MVRILTHKDVSAHNKRDDCWVIIHGKVYNLGPFLDEHPGGDKVILKQAGKDATKAFDPIHPLDIIKKYLPKELYIGDLDPNSKPELNELEAKLIEDEQKRIKKIQDSKPPLSSIFNAFDFEAVAKKVLTPSAWAYYSSGSDDELTLQENHAAFHRIWLKPRVLIDVKNINLSTTMLGSKTRLPIYISATALGKLGHKDGEVVLTKAAHSKGIIQMMPTLASCSLDEMIDAAQPGQPQWFQLYVNQNRDISKKLVQHAEKRGVKALFITVDAPQLGRREKDMRVKFVDDAPEVQKSKGVKRDEGAARAISTFIDPALKWSDIAWFKSITKMKIVLKGIQTGSDAVLAAKSGVDGIVVSNHGGRQLDTVRSGIEILEEVMFELRKAGYDKSIEVFVDGGFRRASDVFKALALGAKGIGMGRPFLYAMGSYGQEGVEKLIDLFEDELTMTMRFMGTTSIRSIKRKMIDTRSLSSHVGNAPRDYLSRKVYDSLVVPKL